MIRFTNHDVLMTARDLVAKLPQGSPLKLYPVPRGGVPVLYALMSVSSLLHPVTTPEEADYLVEDIVDSGSTLKQFESYGKPVLALTCKQKSEEILNRHQGEFKSQYGCLLKADEYVIFPWEEKGNVSSDEDLILRMLQRIGEDPTRQGLLDTPKRVLKAWSHWFSGYGKDPEDVMTTFKDGAEHDSLVIVKDIKIYSHCEHHMAPIIGKCTIGYLPKGKIIGLSKLARLAEIYSRRLQVQERLTNQIAHTLMNCLEPQGVAVLIDAEHMCMSSRGVSQHGATTVTSAMLGCFREESEARMEFLRLAGY